MPRKGRKTVVPTREYRDPECYCPVCGRFWGLNIKKRHFHKCKKYSPKCSKFPYSRYQDADEFINSPDGLKLYVFELMCSDFDEITEEELVEENEWHVVNIEDAPRFTNKQWEMIIEHGLDVNWPSTPKESQVTKQVYRIAVENHRNVNAWKGFYNLLAAVNNAENGDVDIMGSDDEI